MAFDFSDKLEPGAGTMIVDALNLAFRWKHQGSTNFKDEYLETVRSIARSYDCSNIIIAADWGSSTYRKEIFPEYKGNRKELIENQTQEEADYFKEFIEEYERTLELLAERDMKVIRFKGVEADDIAAHLVKNKDKYGFEEIWLISTDRDWDLLIDDDISRFSYITRKETSVHNWYDHYDVDKEEFISYKCILGDKGDNVPGFDQIGEKRAVSLVKQYGSAMDIYDALPINSHYKYIQSLNENPEQILINYQLMDLVSFCDDAIGEQNVERIANEFVD